LTDVQQQTIFNDVQKTLVDGGVPPDAATDVVTDLKKIATETQ
jgi:predicted mannosyl-3-phosphoglycerate phosphatase (HAD superfamily)